MLARRPLTVLVAPLLLLALAGATVPQVQAADGASTTTSAAPPPLIASGAAGATAWSLDKPVRVTVTGGTLTSATLTAKWTGARSAASSPRPAG